MSEQKLVSVEIQKEFDVLNKNWQEQVFVKLYVAARTSGFLADISDRDWKTLCVLATFMDSAGNCYPSQDEIAVSLGVCRQAANERIISLLNYRWQEQPVVVVVKHRKEVASGKKGQRWDNNRYTILPLSNIGFGKDNEITQEIDKKPMSSDHDIGKSIDSTGEKPMSPYPDTGKGDTNKIFKRSVVVVEQPEFDITSYDEMTSSSVKNDGAAFTLPASGSQESCGQATQAEAEKNLADKLVWEKIREDVLAVAGVDISVGFAKEIEKNYPPEKVAAVLNELGRQLSHGVEIRGVGAWLRYALKNDIQPDQKPESKTVSKRERERNNRTPRARPKGLPETSYPRTPEQEQKRKELIKSLYVG